MLNLFNNSFKIKFIIILVSIFSVSCLKKKTDPENTNHLFDPKVPGGVVGTSGAILPIEELQADVSIPGKIKLTWKFPKIYAPLDYTIKIYKHQGNDPNWIFPEPNLKNVAELYKVAELPASECGITPCTSWLDENTEDSPASVVSDTDYNYWVYIYLNKKWSPFANILAHSALETSELSLHDALTFWLNKRWELGFDPYAPSELSPSGQTYSTINARQSNSVCSVKTTQSSCELITGCEWGAIKTTECSLQLNQNACNLKSNCSWNNTNNSCSPKSECRQEPKIGNPKGRMAFAYDGGIMYFADTDNNRIIVYKKPMTLSCREFANDPDMWGACMLQSLGEPFSPVNILGQPSQYTNSPCAVSCSQKTQASCSTDTECSWDISDSKCKAKFPLDKCLTKPADVAVFDDKLYISDTGNNRVVVWDHLPAAPGRTDAGGCDPKISMLAQGSSDCSPSTVIGQKDLSEIKDYSLVALDSLNKKVGDRVLKKPTGISIRDVLNSNGNSIEKSLYIADTGNNRVVKVRLESNNSSVVFDCSGTNGWLKPECKFNGLLGQKDYFTSETFNSKVQDDKIKNEQCALNLNESACSSLFAEPFDFKNCKNRNSGNCSNNSCGNNITQGSCSSVSGCLWDPINIKCIADNDGCYWDQTFGQCVSSGCSWTPGQTLGTGSCSLSNPVIDKGSIGNIISSSYDWVLKRYLSNPTKIKTTSDGKLMILTNEDYSETSVVNTPILLKSRVLLFNSDPLEGSSPVCNSNSFTLGGCDANSVFGQSTFTELVSINGTSSGYTDINYALDSVDDFDIADKKMIATDSVNNFIYLWEDWTVGSLGRPPLHIVQNPKGAPDPNTSYSLPNLKSLGGVSIIPKALLIYVTDAEGHRVYEIRAY